MISPDDQQPPLAHHMTWIHNFPKCDSCVTMNAAGRERRALHHHPLHPELGRHHHPVVMETHESSSRGLGPVASHLPDIVRGRSMDRKSKFEINKFRNPAGQASVDQSQVPHPNSSNILPQISTRTRGNGSTVGVSPIPQFSKCVTRAQQRLAKSLDVERGNKSIMKRRVSLPSLTSENLTSTSSGSRTMFDSSASDSGVYDVSHGDEEETLLSRVSLEDSDSSDEEDKETFLTIHPFPYQSERSPYESEVDIFHPKPPTPIKPKKKKKKEKPPPPPPPKRRPRKAKKTYQRKRPINFVALRRHEQEVARRHPIKKQFLYSNVLETELQSYIPPRLPGGKLKSVYKRNQTGDIQVPEDPIIVQYGELKNEAEQDNVSPWQRRRQEALQAFLERRRKLLKRVSPHGRKKKRVRFTLPPDHVESASEKETDNDQEAKSDDDDVNHAVDGNPNDTPVPEDQTGSDNDIPEAPRMGLIVEEALRSLEASPSRKDSDELVQNWLQTTNTESADDHRLTERTSITDQFVKLPKISETEATSPIDSENTLKQSGDANNAPVTIVTTEVTNQT